MPWPIVWSLPVMALSLMLMAVTPFFRTSSPPLPVHSAVPAEAVEAEAQRLLAQAQKDTQSAETPCYGQSMACPLTHYKQDALIRLAALEQLKVR